MTLTQLVHTSQYRRGAEIGVWRGSTSFALLEACPQVDQMLLVDPWRYERCHFPVPPGTRLPARMPPGWYHGCMGEAITSQQEMEEIAQEVAGRAEQYAGRCRILRMPSSQAAVTLPRHSLDFVYIDATHLFEDVLDDLLAWWRIVRPGGLVSGDDFGSEFPGVGQAVRGFMEGAQEDIRVEEGGLWWIMKPCQ